MKTKKYILLWFEYLKLNIKVLVAYRTDFLVGLISSVLVQAGGILFIWVLFQNVKTLNGWSIHEVMLMYGLASLSKSITNIFLDNLNILGSQYIREGKFDAILLKPIPALYNIIVSRINQDGISDMLIGSSIVFNSVYYLKLYNDGLNMVLLLVFIVFGVAIYSGIQLIAATTSFWIVNSNFLIWAVNSIQDFSLYPINIYNRLIQALLTWVLPYAFTSFYPAAYLVKKDYPLFCTLIPLIALWIWFVALAFWKYGIRNYTSTGS